MKHMSANAIPFNPTSLHDSEDGCVPLLTVVEAAEFLKLSPGSLYHLVSEKRVPVIRISSRSKALRKSGIWSTAG